MHRTQLLLPAHLHRRAAEAARARGMSLGHLVREALGDYLARSGSVEPGADAVDEILLGPPFDDPDPDPALSTDVDHYLYGAPRKLGEGLRPPSEPPPAHVAPAKRALGTEHQSLAAHPEGHSSLRQTPRRSRGRR